MASGDFLVELAAQAALQPNDLPATFSNAAGGSSPAENVPVLLYSAATVKYADWLVRMPRHYDGGGLTLNIEYSMTSTASSSHQVVWGAAIRRFADDAEDLGASHSYDYNDASADTVPSVIGETSKAAITFTSGADMDSWATGENAVVRVRRNPADAGDDADTDAELWGVEITET